MDIIIEKLYKIKEKPIIYIGKKSVILLRAYLDGYLNREMELNPEFKSVFFEFYDFIREDYKMAPNHSWERILTAYTNTDENAFDLFFKYLDKFLGSKNIEIPVAESDYKD